MAVHTLITQPGIYFITFTCHQWIHLIEKTNGFDLVYNWFDVLSTKNHKVTGYVIMPNHLHLLLHYSGGRQSLNTIVGNGKRFIAYDIIERLGQQNEKLLLTRLQAEVKPKDKSRGKKHEVWKDSFDVKECRTEKFILQKLNYIHNNPCTGKWRLVEHPHQYLHSSALFYLNGKHKNYPVKDYREFLYADSSEE